MKSEHAAARDEVLIMTNQCVQLRQELAAERENYALALQMKNIETKRANESEQKLSAEREKVKHVTALLENPKFDDWDRRELLKVLHLTAGARVKEGK